MQLSDIDFVILGVAKAATTWLRHQLQDDPAIYMPDHEPHFFSREYHRGTDWYLGQFDPHPGARLIGEKSNSYFDTPEALPRLHAALPHAKLIVMLRDPVSRAYSDYCMLLRRGEVGPNIEDYLDPRRAANERFIYSSRYDLHLERLLATYGRGAVHVTHYELVAREPQNVLDGVRSHLGLPARPIRAQARNRINDRRSALLPLRLRKAMRPLKPLVRPLRGSAAFESVRGLFARPFRYPELTNDLRARLEEHFAPMRMSLEKMGFGRHESA